MKAMVIDRFGGAEEMHLTEVPTPVPGPGEVLIKVACTSVNPVEWKIREGRLAQLFAHDFPLILGWDAAGTVAALGEGVTGLALDQAVYAYCRKPVIQWGTYAEYVAMPAEAVAPKPESLSFAQASTIPLVGLTAWQSLFDKAVLRNGQTVLIHAGAGGVGGIAIQLAKWAGAKVITTASAANDDYVRRLGADHVIDYTAEDFVMHVTRLAPEGVDVAFATVGGEVMRRSYEVMKPGGFLVSITDGPDKDEAARRGFRTGYVFVKPNGLQLRELAKLIDADALKAPEIEELPLEFAAQALERSKTGHVRGKIVLRVG